MKRIALQLFVTSFTLLLAVSCTKDDDPISVPSGNEPAQEEQITDPKPWGMYSDMDSTVRPGNDFYRYSVGGWLDRNPLKKNEFMNGTMMEMYYASTKQKQSVITDTSIPIIKELQDAMAMSIDPESVAISMGIIKDLVGKCLSVPDDSLYYFLGELLERDYHILFTSDALPVAGKGVVGFDVDWEDYTITLEDEEILQFLQFITNDEGDAMDMLYDARDYFSDYSSYLWNLNQNDPEPGAFIVNKKATRALDCPISDFSKMSGLFEAMGITDQTLFSCSEDYILDALLYIDRNDDLDGLRSCMAVKLVDELVQLAFMPELMMASEKKDFNPIFNQLYCEKVGQSGATQYVSTIIANVRESLIDRIDKCDWLSSDTRNYAKEKVGSIKFFIGLPKQIGPDMKISTLEGTTILEKVLSLKEINASRKRSIIGRPLDEIFWPSLLMTMDFSMANAMYSPTMNAVIIFRGILDVPFVNEKLSDAYNYASIGSTVAHELTHSLDAQGANYDKTGAYTDWWDPADKVVFNNKVQAMIEQMNTYELLPGLFNDGETTINENIADLGGFLASYDAFVKLRKSEGWTDDELVEQKKMFFYSYGQTWKGNMTESYVKNNVKDDVHSANFIRVNSTVANSDAWYELFDVKPGDKNYIAPENRIRIW